ncbi:MAG: 30S ribosome-binding factor RbfA [Aquificaceae bacterium]
MDIKRIKFAKQLKEEIANLVLTELKDPRLEGVVVTGIELSEDMSLAKVYFTTLEEGKEKQAQEALQKAEGFLKKLLLKNLRVKRLPKLIFVFDKELKSMEKVWEKL